MLKIPATDGNTYSVPSWSSFRGWVTRIAVAFILLAVGSSLGIYFYGQRSQQDTINKLNNLAKQSCLAQTQPTSIINKYNDLVKSIIDSRTEALNRDIAKNDLSAVKADQSALDRYRNDTAPIRSAAECAVPILKG